MFCLENWQDQSINETSPFQFPVIITVRFRNNLENPFRRIRVQYSLGNFPDAVKLLFQCSQKIFMSIDRMPKYASLSYFMQRSQLGISTAKIVLNFNLLHQQNSNQCFHLSIVQCLWRHQFYYLLCAGRSSGSTYVYFFAQ